MSKMSQAKLKEQEASTWARKVYHMLHGNARLALLAFTIIFILKYRKTDMWSSVHRCAGYYPNLEVASVTVIR